MPAYLFEEIEKEITNLLCDLIRINTTNPPGNETKAAEYLAKTLGDDDIHCEIIEPAPGRGSIVARIEGCGKKPSLLLLSHIDVVAADPKEWCVNPFEGVIRDGAVWGRGTIDVKSLTAIEIMIMKLLKRNRVDLKGDLILAAVADEEAGGKAGSEWLVNNCPGKVKADYVINEGGGLPITINGKNLYTIETAQKGNLWLRIKAKGTSGHGCVPTAADNAILRMNKVIQRLSQHVSKSSCVATVRQFIDKIALEGEIAPRDIWTMLQDPNERGSAIQLLSRGDENWAHEIRAMLEMTIAPTIVRGGIKENIIPSECEAVFDCRILPGQTVAETMDLLRCLLRDIDPNKLEFETISASESSESTTDTPLYETIVSVLSEFEPSCGVVPLLQTGGTDSRFFRRLGSICYGFQPIKTEKPGEILKMTHGVNENISTKNLVFGASVLYEIVQRLMT
jgi:acetylornithine deacetylase/succinyl-diaminopimelate desuccinylase-like protein